MTNSQSPQTELADEIFSDEALMQAELHRLYNFADDDSRQFTRWQMGVAMLHGHNLASRPSPLVDTGEALREARFLCARLRDLDGAMSDPDAAARDFYGHVAPSLHRLEGYLAALAARPKPEEG